MGHENLSAVDRVVDGIKRGIRSGKYAPGQRLVEMDLVADLAVSRNTLRDGMQRLVSEGLLQFERYRGATVRKMSKPELVELTFIRATLEGLAARMAAKRDISITQPALDAIREKYARESLLNVATYRNYNTDFHDTISQLSGISRLPAFIDLTKLAMVRLHFETLLLVPQRMRSSLKEHNQIEKAILSQKPDKAETAMRNHIQRTGDIILSAPNEFFLEI